MKNIIIASGLLFSSLCLAASPVKITSFRYVDSQNTHSPVTELCGELVTPTGKSELIKVTADPGTSNPGTYHVSTGKDGKFCSLLATYTGNAAAELE